MNTFKTLAYGAVTTGALGLIAMAAPQGGGNSLINFQSGTTALASEVNANFQANRAVADSALSAAMRLDTIAVGQTGNFGLGTAVPDSDFGLVIEDLGVGNDWLGAVMAGSSFGSRAVLGEHHGIATVGGRDANGWSDLSINPGGGNVGIGTETPASKLHLSSSLSTVLTLEADIFNAADAEHPRIEFVQDGGLERAHIGWINPDGPTNNDFQVFTNGPVSPLLFGTDAVERVRITNSGNVGIGTANPGEMLDVAGDIRCIALTQTSDARLKTDVEELDDALEIVRALRGVSYEWDRDELPQADEGRQVGFLAQEVREVLPEAVREDTNGQLAVAYTQVIPVLVEAVQELQAQQDAEIDELLQRNEELSRRVAELEDVAGELAELKAMVAALAR